MSEWKGHAPAKIVTGSIKADRSNLFEIKPLRQELFVLVVLLIELPRALQEPTPVILVDINRSRSVVPSVSEYILPIPALIHVTSL